MAGVKFDIDGNANGFVASTREAQAAAGKMTKSITNEGKALDDMFKKLAGTVATIGAGLSASALVKQMFDIRSEFQQLEIAFGTMLKSKEKANALMKDAAEFAATTPFDLKGVAAGIKSSLAYGAAVDNVIDEMRMLGDVAAGVSMPLNDLVYLYGTLRTSGRVATIDIRQFAGRGIPIYEELAKVLGVAKDEVAGLVTAGKVGFADIEKAFKNMTSAGGMFNNLMADQSKSLGGQYSNLKDNIEMMFNDIGKSQEGVFSDAMTLANKLVENYKEVGRVLGVIVAAYGTYKAAIISVAAVEKAQVAAASVKKFLELTKVMKAATAAQQAFNGAALANPYVLAATALATLIAGVVAFTKHKKAEVEAQKAASLEVAKEVNEVNTLASKLKSTNTSEYERIKALERLKEIAPEVVEGIDAESTSLEALNENLEEYNTLKNLEIALKASTQYIDFTESIQSVNDAKAEMQKKQSEMINLWTDLSTKITSAIGSGELSDGMSKWLEEFMYDPALDMNEKLSKVLKRYNDMMFSRRMGYDYNKDDFAFLQNLARTAGGATGFYEEASKDLISAEENYTKAVEELRKRIHDSISLYITDADQAKKAEEALLKSFGLVEGETGTGVGKDDQKKLTEKQKENAYKRQQAEIKAAESLAKMKKQLNEKVAKADIDSMEDGYAKTLKTLKFNLQSELDAIEEQKKELLKKKKDEAMKSWLAEDPEGRKEYQFVFTPTLSAEEEEVFRQMGIQAQKEFNKGREKAAKEYGGEASFITRQFAIDAMSEGVKKDEAQRKLDNDRELHNLELQRKAYIEAAKAAHILAEQKKVAADPTYLIQMFDETKANESFDKIVEQVGARQKEQELINLKTKYEDYLDAVKRLNKEFADERSLMYEEDGKTLKAGFDESNIVEWERQKQEAMDQLAVTFAMKEETFEAWAGTITDLSINKLRKLLALAKANLTALQNKEGVDPQEIAKATAAVVNLEDAIEQGVANNKVSTTSWTELNEVLSESAQQFSQLGEVIPGITGDILSGIGSVASAAIGVANGITAIGKAASAAEKASAILAIISAVIRAIDYFTSIADENEEANNNAAEAARNYAEALRDLEEAAKIDKNNTIFGDDVFGTLISQSEKARNNLDAITEMLEKGVALHDALDEPINLPGVNIGGSAGDGFSDFEVFDPDYITNQLDRDKYNAERFGSTLASDLRSGWQKFWGSEKNQSTFDMSTLINEDAGFSFMDMLNEDKFNELQEWYAQWGEGLSDENKIIVEQILADWEDYKEAMDQIKESVKSFFSDVSSNVADSVLDSWIETGKAIIDATELVGDYAKALAKSAVESFLLKEVFADAEGQMLNLMMAGDYAGAASLISKLINEASEYAPEITAMFEQINKATGGALSELGGDSDRSAVQKGIAQASQDSVDELNGRMTAIQSHTFSINERVSSLVSISAQILGKVSSIDGKMSMLVDLDKSLALMKSDISDILTKGIRIKN